MEGKSRIFGERKMQFIVESLGRSGRPKRQ